ncbi:PH domain-containing protein [Schaalia naturae]|jgi:membrane protein YdbS with pleckstrin-like domain|uniref:PH domain-containing protein n=1 Tax=Schaalia naturae TaxID=635203 RepID=A0ABW2SIF5_9ACTO
MPDPLNPLDVHFAPVSSALVTVRVIAVLLWTALPAVVCAVLAVVLTPWIWAGAAALLVLMVWLLWLIPRQVRAQGFAETDHEFMIRRGIMFRSLTVVPYGRIQYVDVSEGPIARHFGIASIALHTASAETSGSLDGLPAQEAARLRDMLAHRGSAEQAGL